MNGSINDSAAQQQRDEKFMRMAINEARQALKREEVPIGAVVVAGDRVVGRGHNLVETLQDATAHAEMQALTAASSTLGGKYLRDCTLYVTVEPCVMCAGAIAWSQAARVVWGADDPKRGLHDRRGVAAASADGRRARRIGCRMRSADEGIFQRVALRGCGERKKIIILSFVYRSDSAPSLCTR